MMLPSCFVLLLVVSQIALGQDLGDGITTTQKTNEDGLSLHVGAIGAIAVVAGVLVLILLILRCTALLFSIRKKRKLKVTDLIGTNVAHASTMIQNPASQPSATNSDQRVSMTEENMYEDMSAYQPESLKEGDASVGASNVRDSDPYTVTKAASVKQEITENSSQALYEQIEEKPKMITKQETMITAAYPSSTPEYINMVVVENSSQGLYEQIEEKPKITTTQAITSVIPSPASQSAEDAIVAHGST